MKLKLVSKIYDFISLCWMWVVYRTKHAWNEDEKFITLWMEID